MTSPEDAIEKVAGKTETELDIVKVSQKVVDFVLGTIDSEAPSVEVEFIRSSAARPTLMAPKKVTAEVAPDFTHNTKVSDTPDCTISYGFTVEPSDYGDDNSTQVVKSFDSDNVEEFTAIANGEVVAEPIRTNLLHFGNKVDDMAPDEQQLVLRTVLNTIDDLKAAIAAGDYERTEQNEYLIQVEIF